MGYDILTKLSIRLGFSAEELIHFSVFVRQGDPSITRFMYRVHIKQFDDIQEILQKVYAYQEKSQTYALAIEAYKAKYACLANHITQEDYQSN